MKKISLMIFICISSVLASEQGERQNAYYKETMARLLKQSGIEDQKVSVLLGMNMPELSTREKKDLLEIALVKAIHLQNLGDIEILLTKAPPEHITTSVLTQAFLAAEEMSVRDEIDAYILKHAPLHALQTALPRCIVRSIFNNQADRGISLLKNSKEESRTFSVHPIFDAFIEKRKEDPTHLNQFLRFLPLFPLTEKDTQKLINHLVRETTHYEECKNLEVILAHRDFQKILNAEFLEEILKQQETENPKNKALPLLRRKIERRKSSFLDIDDE